MAYRFIASLGLLAAIVATPAFAGTYKFTLVNKSQYPIVGFETYENDKWSTWSGVGVSQGESQTMDWNTNSGDCVVPFRIIYKDVETEQYKVDWCKITTITVHDDKVTAE